MQPLQVRDVVEMLQRQDQTAGALCVRGGKFKDEEMLILDVERYTSANRDIAIKVEGDTTLSDLEEKNEKLDTALKKAELLLERLQAIDSYVEQSDKDKDMPKLMEDVEKYLDER